MNTELNQRFPWAVSILEYLNKNTASTPSAIINHLDKNGSNYDENTIQDMLSILEDIGLVETKRAWQKNAIVRVSITAKGKAIYYEEN
jgi:DNA-binding MarR family transcriptional regulator